MRLMVVEDSLLVRAGIVRLLEAARFATPVEASDAASALAMQATHAVTAAIVDIRMPPTHTDEGLHLAEALRERGVAALVLSQYLETHFALRLLTDQPAGVGYLLKDRVVDAAQLTDAIGRVIAGETVLDPAIVRRLLARRREHDPIADLTQREVEVLRLVAEGFSNREISRRLFVTERTVEAHVTRVLRRLDIEDDGRTHRRVRAVITFLRSDIS